MQFFEPAKYANANYDQLWAGFKWNIPTHFNIGVAAGRYGTQDPQRIAL